MKNSQSTVILITWKGTKQKATRSGKTVKIGLMSSFSKKFRKKFRLNRVERWVKCSRECPKLLEEDAQTNNVELITKKCF